jgi:hypothetical protein
LSSLHLTSIALSSTLLLLFPLPLSPGDGTVTPGIANELLMLCDDIGMGRVQRQDLLGEWREGNEGKERDREEICRVI